MFDSSTFPEHDRKDKASTRLTVSQYPGTWWGLVGVIMCRYTWDWGLVGVIMCRYTWDWGLVGVIMCRYTWDWGLVGVIMCRYTWDWGLVGVDTHGTGG